MGLNRVTGKRLRSLCRAFRAGIFEANAGLFSGGEVAKVEVRGGIFGIQGRHGVEFIGGVGHGGFKMLGLLG